MMSWSRSKWRMLRKYLRLNISSVQLPWGLGSIDFAPNDQEKKAAWNLYIELTTRITTQRLDPNSGRLREALDSLYFLFNFTRNTLRDAGPEVAYEFGPVALSILNKGIRPFTAKWHPLLQAWEEQKPPNVSKLEHEHAWEHFQAMRNELLDLQDHLRMYAEALAKIAGVDIDLHDRFMDDAHKGSAP